jgi:hypothetical protein
LFNQQPYPAPNVLAMSAQPLMVAMPTAVSVAMPHVALPNVAPMPMREHGDYPGAHNPGIRYRYIGHVQESKGEKQGYQAVCRYGRIAGTIRSITFCYHGNPY